MAVIQTSLSLGMWFTLAPNIAKATEAAYEILRLKDSLPVEGLAVIATESRPASIKFEDVGVTAGATSFSIDKRNLLAQMRCDR